jgi:hypothetical protein
VSDAKIHFELGRDEALVLFELLADFGDQERLELPSPVERLALLRLHGALERTMVEPFCPEYLELLERARKALKEEAGALGYR